MLHTEVTLVTSNTSINTAIANSYIINGLVVHIYLTGKGSVTALLESVTALLEY